MPVTHITFLIACLAISGIPPFSGFFSKDEILTACYGFSPVMGAMMTFIAGLTAFYMFRLYYNIFWRGHYGKSTEVYANTGQTTDKTTHHPAPHEAPVSMTIPLIFLAVVTCVAGFIPFGEFVSSNGEAYTIRLDWTIAAVSVCVAVVAIVMAAFMYKGEKQTFADKLAANFKGLYRAAYHRFYIDEVYQFVTHKIIFGCISKPVAWFDRNVVDGFMNSLAWITNMTSDRIKGLQSGAIQQYTVVFLTGALVLIIILLLI
jgi:NADH-quinone oxidoreductase subunit L